MVRIRSLFFLAISLWTGAVSAQPLRFHPGSDSTRSLTLEGYADVYFGFDFSQPSDAARPYFVSHSRHNETAVNLAYLSLSYASQRARARFTPAFGTYINANYAAERQTLQNLLEATVGVKPFSNRDIWVDAGVFPAPYTTETPLAHDQLLYTRSFAAEYSPYYLTGIRTTLPLSKTVALYLYLVNGWQIIEDVNAPLSFGTALEWKPTEKLMLNWSTYAGKEGSASQPQYGGRYFTDLYAVWTPAARFTISADVYAGWQHLSDSVLRKNPVAWYQGHINARYAATKRRSIGARAEYFRDAHAVLVMPVTGTGQFDCTSATLGYHHAVSANVLFHVEGRYFRAGDAVFPDSQRGAVRETGLIIGGLTAKF